jgi:hypothetical protein
MTHTRAEDAIFAAALRLSTRDVGAVEVTRTDGKSAWVIGGCSGWRNVLRLSLMQVVRLVTLAARQ